MICHSRDHFERFIAKADNEKWYHAIMVRLVIYAGLSQRVIANLRMESYQTGTNSLFVNGTGIRLSEELSHIMSEYLNVHRCYASETALLFVRASGEGVRDMMGSYLCNVLKLGDKAGSVIAVSKNAIIRMLQNHIGLEFIRKLTEYEIQVLIPCVELAEIGLEKDQVKSLFELIR